MTDIISYDSASGILEQLAFNISLSNLESQHKGNTTSEATIVISWQLVSLSVMVLEGLYHSGSECVAYSLIPGFGEPSGAVCVLLSFATMCITSGFFIGLSELEIGLVKMAVKRSRRNKNTRKSNRIINGVNTLDYNHYGSLTHWYTTMARHDLEAGIVDVPSAVYYTHNENLYAANATNWVTGLNGHTLLMQQGLFASRSFLYLNATSDSLLEAKAVDEHENSIGYKVQCCYFTGGKSNRHSDWLEVNALAHDLINEGITKNKPAWELLFFDSNLEIKLPESFMESELEDSGIEDEWNETELCKKISQHDNKCIVQPFKYKTQLANQIL